MRRGIIFLIKGYQKIISPYIARSCRYEPSCSQYAVEALEEYGIIRGVLLSFWRIIRCNPFFRGGHDPVKKHKGTIG